MADPKNLAVCSPEFTIAVVSTSETPTGTQVADPQAAKTDVPGQVRKIRDSVVKVFEIDALGASEALFGSTAPANLLLVGAAFQLGVLPMPATAIEDAIDLNGVAVKANIAAFRWGRVAVADPEAFAAATSTSAVSKPTYDLGSSPLEGETRRLASVRAQLLLEHSGPRAVRQYLDVVERAWAAERAVMVATDYSQAVARGVAHVMAYKDEYEVARLHLDAAEREHVNEEFGAGAQVSWQLHPPVLRATARGRFLRGTALDPFGKAEVRRVERSLIESHTALVERLSASLTAESYATAVAAAGASELIRGFEDIKLRNVDRYRETLTALGL
jgi:indolepyruvate ferredoxin oxidoreductase